MSKWILCIRPTLFLCLASLSASVSATAAAKAAHQKLTIALDWTPNTNHVGLFAAKSTGAFARAGLDVRFVQMKQTSTTQLVGSGKAEFGISFVSDVLNARAQKIPVVSVAAIIQENTSCFAARESTGIRSVKDFEGRRYGGWGSPEEEATLRYVMKKSGADFSKLKIVTTGISDFLPTTQKNADFMWIYMGWDGVRAKLENVKLNTICLRDIDPVFNHPSPLIISSAKFARSNPEIIRKFLAAASEGYQLAINKPQEAARLFMKEVPESDSKIVLESTIFLSREYAKNTPRWGVQDVSRFEAYRTWANQQNILDLKESSKEFVDNSFLPAAENRGAGK
ncbi:ABC transporter substrate-binding protein [bacterium]|nr:ABC transporter substrate-binding protein [bacterium]